MMGKYKSLASAPVESEPRGAVSVAQSVQQDFSGLVAIFDRHLANAPQLNGDARSAILEAKAAAERGLQLSHRLVYLLKDPTSDP
jgi:hypothetical protein